MKPLIKPSTKPLFWKFVKHTELMFTDAVRIAELKDQHWPYGIPSQLGWIKNNFSNDDVHLIGEDADGIIRAYLALVRVDVEYDSQKEKMIGIGGVCVDKTLAHKGYGRLLISKANESIRSSGKKGILLCKEPLREFYRKCGWKGLSVTDIRVAGEKYGHLVLAYPEIPDIKDKMVISRNF